MRVSVCLGAILIPEYLDLHSGYFYSQEQNSWNIFRNVFRNIPNERALNLNQFKNVQEQTSSLLTMGAPRPHNL